jgi:hypothetical protein
MNPLILKKTMAGLLISTGSFHLIVALLGPALAIGTAIAVFGLIYFLLGIYVVPGGRPAVLIAMVFTGLGLAVGGQNFLQHGGPITLPIMLFIDTLIIAAGALWLIKTGAARA